MTIRRGDIERIEKEGLRKPTPAQRAWLVLIVRGGATLNGPSISDGMRCSGHDHPHRSVFAMTRALHDAGWISTVTRTAADGRVDYPVSLTAAGRQVIA